MTTLAEIDDFLSQTRLAFIGISRNPADFSRGLYRDLVKRGYDVVPVNPEAEEIEGQHCFASIEQVQPPVEGALVMTPPSVTDQVVQDCARANVPRVWLHRGAGRGAVTDSAVSYCQEHGMSVVAGFCPYMFLPRTAFFHQAHRLILKLGGHYPAKA